MRLFSLGARLRSSNIPLIPFIHLTMNMLRTGPRYRAHDDALRGLTKKWRRGPKVTNQESSERLEGATRSVSVASSITEAESLDQERRMVLKVPSGAGVWRK